MTTSKEVKNKEVLHTQNWIFRAYNKKDKEILSFTIEGRTEHEATSEGMRYVETHPEENINDWTITPKEEVLHTQGEVFPDSITDEMVQDGFSQPLSGEIANRFNSYQSLIEENNKVVSDSIDFRAKINELRQQRQRLIDSNRELKNALSGLLADVTDLLNKNDSIKLGTMGTVHIVQAKTAINNAKNLLP